MTAPAPLHRENNFDFLRMVAASLVLFSHHFPMTGRGEPNFFSLHSYGGFAVLIFFSISGYLVTQSWYADPDLRRFALRRILRIWPALTVAVAGAALVLGPWVSTLPAGEYFASEGVWRYFHNLHMSSVFVLPGVFEDNPLPAAVNGSLWTIPLEVRCYIVFGLLGAVGLWKKRFFLPAFAVAYAIWYFARYSPDLGEKLNYKHEFATYFFFGAALFALKDTWQKNPLRWGAALAAAGALAAVLGFPYLGLSLVLPYAAIWFGTSATPFIRSAGRYGDFSYGIYLFAFPVQQTTVKYLYPNFGFAGTLCIAYAITLALAVLSWHWVEKTALRLKPRRQEAQLTVPLTELQVFRRTLAGLLMAYWAYLVIFWPGILGQDGLALILESESDGSFKSGKTAFYFLIFDFFYSLKPKVEIFIFMQLGLCAIFLSRVAAWIYMQGMRRSYWAGLVFICLAPHLIFYNASLYSDGLYSCALVAFLFEVWRALKNRRLDRTGIFMLALSMPFALFTRPNGILNLVAALLLIALIHGWRAKGVVAGIAAAWMAVSTGMNAWYQPHSIGAAFPMALWETVNFLQPSPMGLKPPTVTQKTIDALQRHKPLPEILAFYDRDYWDPLWFFPHGPVMGAMPEADQQIITREFYRHNLWANIPAFTSSRVHVFMVAALAQGHIPGPSYAKTVLEQTQSRSRYRRWHLHVSEFWLNRLHDFSLKHRWLLWSPFPGIALIFWLCVQCGLRRRQAPEAVVGLCLLMQLAGVLWLSIAGEYRYLMPFFTATLLLWPLYLLSRKVPATPEKALGRR